MAAAAVSLLQFTRVPQRLSISPFLRNSRSFSVSFKRSCKRFSFFRANSPRSFSVTASSSSSDWNSHVGASDETYDVIVVGGGHAGCEAVLSVLSSARLGAKTLFLTFNIDRIAWQFWTDMADLLLILDTSFRFLPTFLMEII